MSATAIQSIPRCLRVPIVATLLLALAAASPPPILRKAFNNTIVSTYPDNRKAELWLDPSGTYTAMGRRGDRSSGRWSIKGGKLCLKQDHPPIPPIFKYCTPIPSRDRWTTQAVTGETVQVRLVKGRRLAARDDAGRRQRR
jgi:hypothetical protein